MKIARLELENVKRVRAVSFDPAPNGLSVIGGKNGQGKTSVLDAICWALGGERFRPTSPQREGSNTSPRMHLVMDNGIVVDRDGKNATLKVTDPSGRRAGQSLLDEFIDQLALNLPKFMAQSGKEKATTLLRVIGMEEQVQRLDQQEAAAYNRRHAIGQIADQKRKFADAMPSYPDAPEEPVSVSDLIDEQQAILLKNAENQKKREHLREIEQAWKKNQEIMADLEVRLLDAQRRQETLNADYDTAQREAADLRDESTAALEDSIRRVEEINVKVRANLDKEKANAEAADISRQYADLSAEIESIRKQRLELLNSAKLPLPELTVENGELRYKGKAWDCMSGAEQMIVAVSIVRSLNPKCGFVLLDKTEQMDPETLAEFSAWMERQGLQGICTRVSTGSECNIIIEDGMIRKMEEAKPAKTWKEGEF